MTFQILVLLLFSSPAVFAADCAQCCKSGLCDGQKCCGQSGGLYYCCPTDAACRWQDSNKYVCARARPSDDTGGLPIWAIAIIVLVIVVGACICCRSASNSLQSRMQGPPGYEPVPIVQQAPPYMEPAYGSSPAYGSAPAYGSINSPPAYAPSAPSAYPAAYPPAAYPPPMYPTAQASSPGISRLGAAALGGGTGFLGGLLAGQMFDGHGGGHHHNQGFGFGGNGGGGGGGHQAYDVFSADTAPVSSNDDSSFGGDTFLADTAPVDSS